jgi:MoaA/NifB/PqqE/SkfB family radical SAM enzyme
MNVTIFKKAAKLFFIGLCYRYKKKTGAAMKTQALSLEITHRCVARCIMCNIWRIPMDEPELSTGDCLKLLASDLLRDLRELDITGCEPFLPEGIDTLFSGIASLKGGNLKKLRSVAVTTNGFLTEKVLAKTEIILREVRKVGMDLVVVCAMDAVGEIHERIRNVKDAFNKVNKTIQGLTVLRERYPNLIIGLKTTILPVNIDELERILGYASEMGLFTIISPCIITLGWINIFISGYFSITNRENKNSKKDKIPLDQNSLFFFLPDR